MRCVRCMRLVRGLRNRCAVAVRVHRKPHEIFASRRLNLSLRVRCFGSVTLVGAGSVRVLRRKRRGYESAKGRGKVHDFGSPTHSHLPQVPPNPLGW
jgi:hypothetical protein